MSEVCILGHHTAYCPSWPWDCVDWAWVRQAINYHHAEGEHG